MKKLLALLVAGVLATSVAYADHEPGHEAPKTKKVCVEQKDPKTGKVKEVCKTIKVHKKFDGTKVPEKAPTKK